MTSKQKIVTTGTLLSIITLMTYLFFRVDLIEKDSVKLIKISSEKIFNTIRAFDERKGDEANRSNDLEEMVTSINKRIKNLSLLVIAGLDYKIIISGRNNSSLEPHIYEKILYEFTNEKITIPESSEYIIKYYGRESQEKIDEYRFYLFSKIINKSRVFLAYKYMIDHKSLVKIAIESVLIIIFFITISSLLFIISLKSKEMQSAVNDRDLFESSNNFDTDPEKNEPQINKTGENDLNSIKNASLDPMNTYIYKMFMNISKKFYPESLNLFTCLSENHFAKSHELIENSFKIIESRALDTFNLNDDVYRELKKERIMIMDSGRKSIIPVINDNSLLGFIQFIRENALKKDEIIDIRNELETITVHLSEYLMANSFIDDLIISAKNRCMQTSVL